MSQIEPFETLISFTFVILGETISSFVDNALELSSISFADVKLGDEALKRSLRRQNLEVRVFPSGGSRSSNWGRF